MTFRLGKQFQKNVAIELGAVQTPGSEYRAYIIDPQHSRSIPLWSVLLIMWSCAAPNKYAVALIASNLFHNNAS